MRVDVKKFLFIGLSELKDEFFDRSQKHGVIHFIDETPKLRREVPEEIHELLSAIRVLRGLPTIEQEEREDFENVDELVKEINTLHKKLAELDSERREVFLEIREISPFGDWNFSDIDYIQKQGNRKFQFFCSKEGTFTESKLPIHFIKINTDNGLDYFVSISQEKLHPSGMLELRFENSYRELVQKREAILLNIIQIEQELKTLAKFHKFLHKSLVFKHNIFELKRAKNLPKKELDDTLFTTFGYVPVDQIEELATIVEKFGVHFEQVEIEPHDVIPTCLKNKGLAASGEDLVHIYDTPSHTDADPSIWVLCAFALFFSMIVGDAGYGLVYLGVTLYLRYKFPKAKGAAKRVLRLSTLLCICCIGWGLITHSFFGIEIGPDNPIRKVSVLNWLAEKKASHHLHFQDDTFQEWKEKYPGIAAATSGSEVLKAGAIEQDGIIKYELNENVGRAIMLELALLIGVIHISFSLMRYLRRNLSNIGWILTLIGGYLYFPHYLGATSLLHYAMGVAPEVGATEGIYLMGGGLVLAIFLGLVTEGLMGLIQLTNVIQIFADVMSYLRLYALGLAGTIVSETVNELGAAVPFVVAIVLISLGHVINMALGIMGGVIHGLRLNFLEWYHYSFEGGGKLYNPLRLLDID